MELVFDQRSATSPFAQERELICEVCGQKFTGSHSDTKTCSKKCKQTAYRRRKRGVERSR